jgi:hypothetical protein
MFALKSYIHSTATFSGICHPFRRALSSMVSLYSATSIDPDIFVIVFLRFPRHKTDLPPAWFVNRQVGFEVETTDTSCIKAFKGFECDFSLTPGMRQNCIRGRAVEKLLKTKGGDIQKAHYKAENNSS